VAVLALAGTAASSAAQGDVLVSNGSPPGPFAQNKQNEPAVAIDAHAPQVLAAGANDEIDLEACAAGDPTSCPFTPGVGVSGVYFSFDGGHTWTQPTYTGWTARHCLGPAECTPHVGPIGTLPWYYEAGLASDGDPAVTFGPRPDANGSFSWANGSRLYYANLTANFSAIRSEQAFKGFEAIAVSRTDSPQRAAADDKTAWCVGPGDTECAPVIVSKQNAALFSDKEAIWADNAESSRFFGNVYLCNAAFRSQEKGNAVPEPIIFARSTDGGDSWRTRQLSGAANAGLGQGRQGCTVRTDSEGVVYVFWESAAKKKTNPPFFDAAQLMARSFDGGRTFERPRAVASVVDCGKFEPVGGDITFDGLAGARTNSFPSVDIANGAPTGFAQPHNDRIVMTWCNGPTPVAGKPSSNEQALVQYSLNRGASWSGPVNGAEPSDRPDFPAVAVSPDGTDVYLVYDAFLQPWQPSILSPPRLMQGVVRHAAGSLTGWTTLHRGLTGDARASSANALVDEFLGDYNYAAATNDYGTAVWNDVRDAAECPAVDAWRQSLATDDPLPKPAPNSECPPTFGNTDIFGGSFLDPTP
jgi:hypothetical protein